MSLLIVWLLPCLVVNGGFVGMNYETWFNSAEFWSHRFVTPLLGLYRSSDPAVIKQHEIWMRYAGVDFVHVDWSNQANPALWPSRPDLQSIVNSTDVLFDTYLTLPNPPQIMILLGAQSSEWISAGWLSETANIIKQRYLTGPRARLFFHYLGKPLLTIYLGTPAWSYPHNPTWTDSTFTVRWMTGFIESQAPMNMADTWSWISRDPVPISMLGSVHESMTVTPAYPGQRGWGTVQTRGRMNGTTYEEQWDQALRGKPEVVFLCQWNEYGEEASPEYSNEIEPTVEFGYKYLNITAAYTRRYHSL